jgi:hypothetical protein
MMPAKLVCRWNWGILKAQYLGSHQRVTMPTFLKNGSFFPQQKRWCGKIKIGTYPEIANGWGLFINFQWLEKPAEAWKRVFKGQLT